MATRCAPPRPVGKGVRRRGGVPGDRVVPLPPPNTAPGERTPGLANVALLRRPGDLDEATWRQRWHIDHTPVAIETQSTFGYTQNAVVRPLTAGAPVIDAIVEELFPLEATSDLHAFFGAADDDDCATGWSAWWPAPPRSARIAMSTRCRRAAMCCGPVL